MRFSIPLFLLCALLVCAPLHALTFEVQVQNFEFSPNDLTIQPGDSVRWINESGGAHSVVSDDGVFSSGAPQSNFTFTQVFPSAGSFRYHCSEHSSPGLDINTNMNGIIRVAGPPRMFEINQGISGAWFQPATSGQGFMIDVEPASPLLFLAWFTYAIAPTQSAAKVGSPDHRWLSAQGGYTGDTASMPIFQTDGGVFNASRPTVTTQVGTMILRFSNCTQGTVTYSLPGNGLTGEIAIQRLIPGSEDLCEMLQGTAATSSEELAAE